MADRPASPFSGLDKALLRSTQPAPRPDPPAVEPEAPPEKSVPARRSSSPSSKSARVRANDNASTLASYHAETDVVAAIRKIVKVPGREVSFVRLTADEKGQLADIVYTYKRQGKKTSENEINRIAVNYILADYKANGERSILAQVIDALLA